VKQEVVTKLRHNLSQITVKNYWAWANVPIAIIVVGITSAIALPSFSRPVTSTRGIESEAKQYCGAMNRGQQAYFLEKNKFTTKVSDLGIGIRTRTANYTYSIQGDEKAVAHNCLSRKSNIRSFIGVVTAGEMNGEVTTSAILCRADSPGVGTPQDPVVVRSNPPEGKCPSGYSSVR
jgi:type II secretory pathway pseudopilin PulG